MISRLSNARSANARRKESKQPWVDSQLPFCILAADSRVSFSAVASCRRPTAQSAWLTFDRPCRGQFSTIASSFSDTLLLLLLLLLQRNAHHERGSSKIEPSTNAVFSLLADWIIHGNRIVLERRSATRDAHDGCHVVQVMRHGFDELFSPGRFIDPRDAASSSTICSLSLSLSLSLSPVFLFRRAPTRRLITPRIEIRGRLRFMGNYLDLWIIFHAVIIGFQAGHLEIELHVLAYFRLFFDGR